MSASVLNEFRNITKTDTITAERYVRKSQGSLERALDTFFSETYAGLARDKLQGFFSSLSSGQPTLSGNQLLSLCEASSCPADDAVWLAIACECDAKTMGCFTLEEWLTGMRAFRIDSTDSFIKSIPVVRKRMADDFDFAKKVYRFSFGYALEPGTRNIAKEDALSLWNLLMINRGWALFEDWLHFVGANIASKTISRDTWNLVWDLAHSVKADLSDYDTAGAWPVAIDEFVEFQRNRSG